MIGTIDLTSNRHNFVVKLVHESCPILIFVYSYQYIYLSECEILPEISVNVKQNIEQSP